MMRLLILATIVALLAGCDTSRQLNPGAAVPIILAHPQHMPHPDWSGAFVYDNDQDTYSIVLSSHTAQQQRTAILLHEFAHLLDTLTRGEVRHDIVHALRLVDAEGFRTDWEGSCHPEGVSW